MILASGAAKRSQRGSREEAEKPFWISFSDLMSALMVLFLVAMSVALLAVTKRVSEEELAKNQRDREIAELLRHVASAAEGFQGIRVAGQSIDFGDQARFEYGSYKLTDKQAALLRAFVPKILTIASQPQGEKWLKQIVVEGFTDQQGSYLFNLNLSLERSQRVLCALLAPPGAGEEALNDSDKEKIRDLFLVGGYSFNSAKERPEESRRIELRLEFASIDEGPRLEGGTTHGNFGTCAI